MFVEPVNKLLVVERVQLGHKRSEVDGFKFVVPDSTRLSRFAAVKLMRAENGSRFQNLEGKFLLVQESMIDHVDFEEIKFCTVSENGVVAVLKENEL